MGNTLQIERLGNVKGQSVLCLKGPLTMENVSRFQGAIRREESFSTVILDLSKRGGTGRASRTWPSATFCGRFTIMTMMTIGDCGERQDH